MEPVFCHTKKRSRVVFFKTFFLRLSVLKIRIRFRLKTSQGNFLPVLSLLYFCTPTLSTKPVAGVLDKPYSQLTPLSRVAVQAHQSTVHTVGWNRFHPTVLYVAWRAGMATPLSWLKLSKVRLKLPLLFQQVRLS